MPFRALVLTQGADRKVTGAIETLDEARLPAGDVTVAVEYSTLNYKDGLVLTSGGGLVKTWPHVGGIDFAGTVEKSDNAGFKPGDKVVLEINPLKDDSANGGRLVKATLVDSGKVYDTNFLDAQGNPYPLEGKAFFNLYAQYRVRKGPLEDTRFRIGARNIFDTQPPITADGYLGSLYVPYGRYIYASIGKKF